VFTNQNPNAYAIFTIEREDKDDSPNVATSIERYLTVATNDDNAIAKIILTNLKYDSKKGYDSILGQITNVGNETAEKIRVLLSYYDQENFIIGKGYLSPVEDTLAPGQKSAFRLMKIEDKGDVIEAVKISFKWGHPDGTTGSAEDVQLEDESDNLVDSVPKKLKDEEIEKLGDNEEDEDDDDKNKDKDDEDDEDED
jgi:hypothetical protein